MTMTPQEPQAVRDADGSGGSVPDGGRRAARRLELPGVEWRRVSPKFIAVEFISAAAYLLVITAAAVFVAVVWNFAWVWLPYGVIAIILVITAAFIPRRTRAIGYQLREDDLLFRRGIMWQRFVAVPYGRMQLIDINRGPLSRAFGLADLKFVTASASTGVVINGLPDAEAEALRDHLVTVAESRRTGL
ncbi:MULTISPECIES: PH domain-containing protein [unclassified Plantibacter]|uniref:PH domain-containing protein n=1 Tax=unclassified Plantibacter TaxID=2624265 RepID=UPI003D348A23